MSTVKRELVSLPSAVSDNLVQSVNQKIRERWRFTISELSCLHPQILCTILCEIITARWSYDKFCITWVPEILTGMHKTQRTASACTFLEQYHKNNDTFLSHVIWVMKPGSHLWMLNSHSHSSTAETFQLRIFEHRPYNPDLAPSDYHLFTTWITCLHHSTPAILSNCWKVPKHGWAHSQQISLTGVQTFIPRHNKCLNSGGDYIEKQLKYVQSCL
jgi:hypothetical protein